MLHRPETARTEGLVDIRGTLLLDYRPSRTRNLLSLYKLIIIHPFVMFTDRTNWGANRQLLLSDEPSKTREKIIKPENPPFIQMRSKHR